MPEPIRRHHDARSEIFTEGMAAAVWMAVAVCGIALLGAAITTAADLDAPAPAAAATSPEQPLGLVPRDFEIAVDKFSVISKGELIVADDFAQDGVFHPPQVAGKSAESAPYVINRGSFGGWQVRDGNLVVDPSGMVNTFENYSADFTVPIDASGRTWFVGKELFGDLEISATVTAPHIVGPTRFAIGLVDLTDWFSLGAVSVGPEEVRLRRQGHPRFPYLPFIKSRFDRVDLLAYHDLEAVEMTLRVGAQGELTGFVKVRDSGETHSFDMKATPEWSKLDPEGQYAVQLLWETWPKPRLWAFHPQYVQGADMRETAGFLELMVFGIGIFEDSEVEIFRRDAGVERHAEIREVKGLLMRHGIKTKLILPFPYTGDYSVRVTTGGDTAEIADAFRVN
jgi:hypothetical protein